MGAVVTPRCSTLFISLLLVTFIVLGIQACLAEDLSLPETPSHRFLDRQNKIAFATLGGLIALDGVHTQLMLATNRYVEGDPLAQPFVRHGWPGQLAGSALGYGAALSLSYMLHRTGHHKIERWATWFMVSAEATNDTRNLLLNAPPRKTTR